MLSGENFIRSNMVHEHGFVIHASVPYSTIWQHIGFTAHLQLTFFDALNTTCNIDMS